MSKPFKNKKIALIGGGGLRTPLLVHGLAHSDISAELALFDIDRPRLELIAALCRQITDLKIRTPERIEEAVEGADFVISSLRVGGIEARARDERITNQHGLAGQETTGPGGFAMALRTIPVALQYARTIERYAPKCWLINFTNPAGLITQALIGHSSVRVVGICDTPAELFHRIAWTLGEPYEELEFNYSGINHLGWVQHVLLRGIDVTERLFSSDEHLRRLYPADLFDPQLLRALRLIPTEYLFFYYSPSKAYRNQNVAGTTRGAEIVRLNEQLLEELARKSDLKVYKRYLNSRNASYMRLEAEAGSALNEPEHPWDPFEGATGYHRIAIDVMTALCGRPSKMVVNIRDGSSDDVVEVPGLISEEGPTPLKTTPLPEHAQRLVAAVKDYERLAIRAAVEQSFELARRSLFANPLVGDWEQADAVTRALIESDPRHLGYLQPS